MITMTWLSSLFSVTLMITFLLAFRAADYTSAHSPKYNEKDIFRNRRSISSSKENIPTPGSTTELSGPSNKTSETAQVPETTTKTSNHTQVIIINSTQSNNSTLHAPQSSGSNKNIFTSTNKPPSVSNNNVSSQSSPSNTSSDSTTTSDKTQSFHPELRALTSQPTPAAGHTTVLGNATVTGVAGDLKKRMTTDQLPTTAANTSNTSAIDLHPRPRPKVTSTAVTMSTSKTLPPPTPKKNDCPLQTAIPGQKQSGLVSNCLIAIGSLAGLATFFLVCSIVLCTKLSAAKHRLRFYGGEGTEMVCISSLLPDGDGMMARPKIPKSNGALIPIVSTDGDSDCGDNLTLNSFLPDGDRV